MVAHDPVVRAVLNNIGDFVSFEWNELDRLAVSTAKVLTADAVEKAGSGHPGTPISLAAVGYLLYSRHLRFDPRDPDWVGRDRFVLSAGHAAMLQYTQLFYAGAGVELDDIKNLRKFGSKLPGHPERGVTPGVEVTTGPLGSGFAAAVGMAMASRREHGLFDPDAPTGESPFDHTVYVVAGDGCLQEGISQEAASIAGTQELGNLVVIWDDNRISIEDDTCISFNEDVEARFRALGWHTDRVDWRKSDGSYVEDVEALNAAIDRAKREDTRPSLIALSTIIGYPTPTKSDTGAIHGAKLGDDALRGLKEALGFDPDKTFVVDEGLLEHTRAAALDRARHEQEEWDKKFAEWARNNHSHMELFRRIHAGQLPEGLKEAIPTFPGGKPMATRAASGQVLNSVAKVMPELWGGSADLGGSNNTLIHGEPSFFPTHRSSKEFEGNPYGRNLHFGVREHAMAAIMNGIASDRLTRVYGGTFFVFADYMRGSVRLSALMNLPVIYIWTHDSIGVGEDGPTHQPVEHLTAYRAIPNLALVRPADAAETAVAWLGVLEHETSPSALILSRQDVPNPARGEGTGLADAAGVLKGGYVLSEPNGEVDVILIASGSEVQHALQAQKDLASEGVGARVVSMPCMEWFEAQPQEYRESVLLPDVKARVSVEAGLALPWRPYIGDAGESVSIETFGVPGAGTELFEHFGFTAENVAAAARKSLASVGSL